MKLLITNEEFDKLKWLDIVPAICDFCGNHFERPKRSFVDCVSLAFCSQQCCQKHMKEKSKEFITKVSCKNCNKSFNKRNTQIKKCPNNFCSSSCAATYNNAHKTKGTRVSKIEVWLSKQLVIMFPEIQFSFNDKTAINSELDIYIPEFKLAFEINGIFHYKPIYGDEKLKQIQNNDAKKKLACENCGITLHTIDISQQIRFTEDSSYGFLTIICNVINSYAP